VVELLNSLASSLESGAKLHAIAVHTPVALSILGVPLVLVTAFVQREKNTLRTISLIAYLLLVGTAFGAVRTGDMARSEVPSLASAEVWDLLEQHEQMGEAVWIFGAVTAACLLLSYVPVPGFRNVLMALAALAAMATASWVGVTGHYGGDLVYTHGVGTQPFNQAFEEMDPLEESEPAEDEAEDAATAAVEPPPEPQPEPEGDFMPIREIDMEAAAKVSYTEDIIPLIDFYCVECHGDRKVDGGYDMTTYENLFKAGDKHGPAIIAGEPDESPVVQYVRGILRPQMPKGDDPLLEEELHTLRMWIAAGAVNDGQ